MYYYTCNREDQKYISPLHFLSKISDNIKS